MRVLYPTRLPFACLLLCLVANVVGPVRADDSANGELQSLTKSRSTYRRALEDLAETCAELGQAKLAAAVRSLDVAPTRGKQQIFLPPSMVPANMNVDRRIDDSALRDELNTARRNYADQLWDQAELSLEAAESERSDQAKGTNVARAYRLAHEAAFIDPNHPQARHVAMAGYTLRQASAAKPAKSKHKEYGWPAGSYWRVNTDHFLIVTNHSAEAATDAGRVLEETYSVWRQMFAQLWLTPNTLRRVFNGAQLPRLRRQHKVVLFADRDEYVRRLQPVEPNVGVSTGMYRDLVNHSYFYMDASPRIDTWRHELTHQLFQEVLNADPGVGQDAGFWAIEAVALYMESARKKGGCYELGGVDARRLQFARYRALNERFYLPIAELSAMSKDTLQRHPEIKKLYSQAAGLAHFLFDDEPPTPAEPLDDAPPKYRWAFIQHLGELYRNGNRARNVMELSGISAAGLDYAYHDYLKISDRDLASAGRAAKSGSDNAVKLLCLGHTKITDKGLGQIARLPDLEWLDLTGCRVSDEGVATLPRLKWIKRLSLEGTSISDQSCAKLATFANLEELDLSHTAVTDAGLESLVSLRNLKSLWLTGTRVTDQSITTLLQLQQLEHLNIAGTSISAEAWEELQAALPRLGKDDSVSGVSLKLAR